MAVSLTKLPWYGQVGAFVILALGGVGAFFYYYEMPARDEIATKQTQLTAIRAEIQRGLTTANKLADFRAEVTDLEGRLSNLRAILPEEKDAQFLLRQLQTVAAQSNVTIKSFKPSPTVTKTMHVEWPIALDLDGTYHNLATFFDRVGRFTRIVNISAVDIKARPLPEPNATISASCVATTFVLMDKAEAPKPGAKPGAVLPPAAAKGL
jgi:type IV pilus assembly protein PilO